MCSCIQCFAYTKYIKELRLLCFKKRITLVRLIVFEMDDWV
jgi:hypothetical protein